MNGNDEIYKGRSVRARVRVFLKMNGNDEISKERREITKSPLLKGKEGHKV